MAPSFSRCSSGQRKAASSSIMNTWLLWLLAVLLAAGCSCRWQCPVQTFHRRLKQRTDKMKRARAAAATSLGSLRFQVFFWGAKWLGRMAGRTAGRTLAIKFQCSPIDPNKECSGVNVNSLWSFAGIWKYSSDADADAYLFEVLVPLPST